MKTAFNKTLMASAFGLALLGGSQANAANLDFTFDTTAIPGSTVAYTFNADEMTWTSQGLSTVSVTDASGDGTLNGIDSFIEIGVVDIVSFQDNNTTLPGFTTGANFFYQLMVDFSLSGYTTLTPLGQLKAVFTGGSGTFWYDEALDSALNGTETAIAGITSPGGDCLLNGPTSFAQGSCKIAFDFDLGVMAPGVFTSTKTGLDLGLIPTTMVVDVNVNNLSPALEFVYPGGPGSVQTVGLDHDGSAVFVPEPGILALLGIGAFGLAGFTRKKRA